MSPYVTHASQNTFHRHGPSSAEPTYSHGYWQPWSAPSSATRDTFSPHAPMANGRSLSQPLNSIRALREEQYAHPRPSPHLSSSATDYRPISQSSAHDHRNVHGHALPPDRQASRPPSINTLLNSDLTKANEPAVRGQSMPRVTSENIRSPADHAQEPAIKHEFGRMFSGLGSGAGGSTTPTASTPTRRSPILQSRAPLSAESTDAKQLIQLDTRAASMQPTHESQQNDSKRQKLGHHHHHHHPHARNHPHQHQHQHQHQHAHQHAHQYQHPHQ